ncbi:MAG: hypothetical protein Q6373_009090 [Candidatus Sigynarchaeota archaeon]
MAEYEQLYNKMHRTKISIAITASLLIGSCFLAIFMGGYKITPGLLIASYKDYQNFHVPVPARDGGPCRIIAYTPREIILYSGEKPEGSNDLASVIVFDMKTGKQSWKLDGPEPLINVGLVENVNEWYNGNTNDPVLLVQFAKVEAIETTYVEWIDKSLRFRNETGTYRTFTWNLGTPTFAGSVNEITGTIGTGGRAIGVIRLPYDPLDDLADYIIVTTNRTWQTETMRVPIGSGEVVLYTMYAMHANGSLSWQINSTTSGSILATGSNTYWNNIHGFAFNASHFIIQLPGTAIGMASIKTGDKAWTANHIREIIEFPRDYSGDAIPDLVCFNDTSAITCINGRNGSMVANFTAIPLGNAEGNSARMASRFGIPFDLFLAWDDSTNQTLAYRHDTTGVSLLWAIDHGDYKWYNWRDTWETVFYYTGQQILRIHVGIEGTNDNYHKIIDCNTGTTICDVDNLWGDAIAGYFFDEWAGPELLGVSVENGYYVRAPLEKAKAMFELDSTNAILFFSAMIVGVVSGLLLIGAKRVHSRLSRQEEAIQPELVAKTPEVTTTRATTKTLRGLSIAMLLVMLAATIVFIVFVIIIGMGENYYNSENYHAIRNSYLTISITFVSLPVIAILYNHFSPTSAMLYIKIQRFFYRLQKKRKEYKVVVLDLSKYGKKHSIALVMSRSLFPLLVSLTLGLTVFGTFASETTGLSGTTGSMNMVWLAEFELLAGLTFIASYLLLIFISPGGWLLDDCGVVYFEQPRDVIHPGDISKISDWLTSWLKGLFGITALINYYQLFAGTDFLSLVDMEDPLMGMLLLVFVLMIMLVFTPILYGLIAMFSANASMIDDLEFNRKKLFDKLRKAGIDVTPRRLKDFFERG